MAWASAGAICVYGKFNCFRLPHVPHPLMQRVGSAFSAPFPARKMQPPARRWLCLRIESGVPEAAASAVQFGVVRSMLDA